jgi:hypothetical protein
VDPSHSLWREGEVGATSIALNQEKISKSRQGEKNYPISKIIVGGTDDVLTSHYTVVQDQMSGGIVTFTLDLETIEKALIENGHHEKDVLTESLSEFSGCVLITSLMTYRSDDFDVDHSDACNLYRLMSTTILKYYITVIEGEHQAVAAKFEHTR